MKKFYSLVVALLLSTTSIAQVQSVVLSPGVFKITYGAANDYSFYSPGVGTQTFYIHCFVNTGDSSTGAAYNDSWGNSNVQMNYDAGLMAYVGIINLNAKTFTNTNDIIPSGTTITKIGMVFKNLKNGADFQSPDVFANGPTTTDASLATTNANLKSTSSVISGKLYTSQKGKLNLEVYEMSGKLVKSFSAISNGSAIDLNVNRNGIYLVKISNGSTKEVVKFVK
jgi:uncharacterized FlaG/YvyC family protein